MGFNSKNLLFNSIIDEVTSTMLYYNLILSYQYFKNIYSLILRLYIPINVTHPVS